MKQSWMIFPPMTHLTDKDVTEKQEEKKMEDKNPFVEEKKKPSVEATENEKAAERGANAMYDAFKSIMENMMKSLDAKNIVKELEEKCTEWFKKEYGAVPMLVQPVTAEGKPKGVPKNALLPSCAPDVLQFIANDIPVFLVGPAGCGKNEMVKKLAEVLKTDYYYSNCVTMEHKITGWTNASGQYMATPFYEAWTKGGIFLLDEMDASTPEVIDVMNMAIANRMCDFPAPIGNLKAHENFRLIAAGNTFGEGADSQYSSRNKLDAATLDRFACVEMGYEEKIEDCICPDKELATFLREMRKAIENAGMEATITYRCFNRSYKMMKALGLEKTIRTCITKHMRKEDIEIIKSRMEGSVPEKNEWMKAINKMAKDWK